MGKENPWQLATGRWLGWRILNAALVGTLLSWTETWWWLGDIATSLRPCFAAVLAAGCLVAWLRGRTGWALVFGVLSLTYPLQVLPGNRELDPSPAESEKREIKVFCHNVDKANRQSSAVLSEIRSISPDIAVLIEVDTWWANQLQELEANYPYHLVEARDGVFGMAIFSRRPLRESRIQDFSGYELPSVRVKFDVDGREVTLIGTHPPPPANAFSFRIRNWHLGELAREARLRESPLIVAGDFNCVPWSAAFRLFLKNSGLRKSGVSREVTWSPFRCPWLGFPVDYQLASEEWRVVHCQTGTFLGSDHRWTLVEFQLTPNRR